MLKVAKNTLTTVLTEVGSPVMIYDLHAVRLNMREFRGLFSNFEAFYSTKTCPEPQIIDLAIREGFGFDAASINEIEYLIDHGASPAKILYTHPVKSMEEIVRAYILGIRIFTIDDLDELILVEKHAPAAKILLRILPRGNHSMYEYGDKFGSNDEQVRQILDYAAYHQVKVHGISFHVGSQSFSIKPWVETLKYCSELIVDYYSSLPSFRIINVGSGFPVKYAHDGHVELGEIAKTLQQFASLMPPDVKFYVEPGRILVGPAANLITTVIKSLTRNKKRWLFTDISVYQGLIEILESGGKFSYPIISGKRGVSHSYNIAGKTLDPDDTIARNMKLAGSYHHGDTLQVGNVGAYTTMFMSTYHFINEPSIYFIDSAADSRIELGTSKSANVGVIAKKSFSRGDYIFTVTGYFTQKRTRNSFQVGSNQHIEPTIFGAYLNHSCTPNAGVIINDGLPTIIAMREIKPGDEVTTDYAMFEYQLGPMSKVLCLCRTVGCRKHITGYIGLPRSKRIEYRGFAAAWLEDKWSRSQPT